MKGYYENTCLGCDLINSRECPHYPKNKYPGHHKNISSPSIIPPQIYSHQYVELRNGIYEGTMSNFKREGLGIFYSDEAFICIGSWLQDYLEGKSIIFFLNGGYLCANFTNNKINGLGLLKLKNSSMIVGVWKNNNLEGIAFHHYPEKCSWIQCEYQNGELIRYRKEEKYSQNDKNVKLPDMLNEYPEIKNLILTHATSNLLYQILKEMKINVRGKFQNFKMLSILRINKESMYLGYAEDEKPNGLGVVYDQNLCIFMCGYFKGGFINGIGRINFENGNIYEGLMKKMSLYSGVSYVFETNTYEFGNFKDGKCYQIYERGEGFPTALLKNFKGSLHKRHMNFSDKDFQFTQNNKKFAPELFYNSDFELPEKDEDYLLSKKKLKIIDLKPASFLEEESLNYKFNQRKKNDELFKCMDNINFSPYQQIRKSHYKNNGLPIYVETYPKNPDAYDINILKAPDIFPLNLSQQILKENLKWKTYERNFDIFENTHNFSVSSINNDIVESKKFSKLKSYSHLDKEIVELSKKKIKPVFLQKNFFKNSSFQYVFEEKFNKELENERQKNNSFQGKTYRSISVASPMKKDVKPNDDLRELLPSKIIKLESNHDINYQRKSPNITKILDFYLMDSNEKYQMKYKKNIASEKDKKNYDFDLDYYLENSSNKKERKKIFSPL